MKKFTLENVEKDSQAITTYVQDAMKKMNMGSLEIAEYMREVKRYDYTHMMHVSQEYIDMLNQMVDSQNSCKVTYIDSLDDMDSLMGNRAKITLK